MGSNLCGGSLEHSSEERLGQPFLLRVLGANLSCGKFSDKKALKFPEKDLLFCRFLTKIAKCSSKTAGIGLKRKQMVPKTARNGPKASETLKNAWKHSEMLGNAPKMAEK